MILQKLSVFGRNSTPERSVPENFPRDQGRRESTGAGFGGFAVRQCLRGGLSRTTEQVSAMTGNPSAPKIKSLQAVTVNMQLASAEEVRRVEKGMTWLATTGSVTPFIGLFGTVWGIIDAFSGLGSAGAASLRAVAPGISEALVTTAAGLFTAIPAVIFL